MRRQFAALIAVLGLVASACTSSADAGQEAELAAMATRSPVSSEDTQAARLIGNFFKALREKNHYALYAMFTPDDACRPVHIEALLAGVEPGIAETSEIEVDEVTLHQVGTTYSVSFTLLEYQGADEKRLVYDEFFPIEQSEGSRWRFAADLCEWLASPEGDEVRSELSEALSALQSFYAEHGTYLATGNDLRYYVSGLDVTVDELDLEPGGVLLTPGDQQALLLGQGSGGGWYCIVAAAGLDPGYGAGPTFDAVGSIEACLTVSSTGGW